MKKTIFSILTAIVLLLSISFIATGCNESYVTHEVAWTIVHPPTARGHDAENPRYINVPVTARVENNVIQSGSRVVQGSNINFSLRMDGVSNARVYRVEVWRGAERLTTQYGTAFFSFNNMATWTLENVRHTQNLEFRLIAPYDLVETISRDEAEIKMTEHGWFFFGIPRAEWNFVLLDVRFAEEYSTARLYGTRHIHYASLAQRIYGVGEGENRIEGLMDWVGDDGKDTLILLYCLRGIRTVIAAQLLQELGFTNVIDIGGILDWFDEIWYCPDFGDALLPPGLLLGNDD